MECNRSENLKNCSCTYPCERKGNCCKCVRYHLEKGQVPGCFFPPEWEKKYDRSIEALARSRGIIP